jgi:EAL domain
MPRRIPATAAALAVVVATLGVGAAGAPAPFVTQAIDDAAQLAAVGCCLWSARRYRGGQRAWRLWLALGLALWSGGQVVWSYNQLIVDRPPPSPSPADAGYPGLTVPALPALVSLPGRRTPASAIMPRPARAVVVLDGLMLVGALFVLTWTTTLGAVVQAGAPIVFAYAVAVAYPVTDLLLVIIVVLMPANSPVPRATHRQLVMPGGGLSGIALSDSVFAYLVASGGAAMPPLADTGFVVGPALPALTALIAVTIGAGVGFVDAAEDDFGTGYNALHLLHALPAGLVELDRPLIVAGTTRALAVCRSIVAICTDLGVRVIAEGIETPARSPRWRGWAAATARAICSGGPGRCGRPRSLPSCPAELPRRAARLSHRPAGRRSGAARHSNSEWPWPPSARLRARRRSCTTTASTTATSAHAARIQPATVQPARQSSTASTVHTANPNRASTSRRFNALYGSSTSPRRPGGCAPIGMGDAYPPGGRRKPGRRQRAGDSGQSGSSASFSDSRSTRSMLRPVSFSRSGCDQPRPASAASSRG